MRVTFEDGFPRRLEFAEWLKLMVDCGKLEPLTEANMSLAAELHASGYELYLEDFSLQQRDYVIAAIRSRPNTIRLGQIAGGSIV
jgi:hypothetical protein